MSSNSNKNHKAVALFVATLMLSVCIVGIVNEEMNEEETTTVDAVPVWVLPFIVGSIIGSISGFTVGHYIFPPGYTGPDINAVIRGNEAALMSQSISDGGAYYDNALDNYAQIWTLTNPHWIRQAELTTSALWSPDKNYDPTEMLYLSSILQNSAYMLKNSTAQINEHYREISDTLVRWNGITGYADNMELRISLGNNLHYGSKTVWEASIGSAVPQVTAGHDKVYLSGGKLWSSSATTLTSVDGQTLTLYSGWNDLNSISGFVGNIYTLPVGQQFLGEGLLPLLESNAANVYSGMVLTVGSTTKLIHYRNGHVYDGNQEYNAVYIDIIPTGAETKTNNITDILNAYDAMLSAVTMSMVAASSASSVLWNVFDNMGAASAYLTTLMVPDNYANVNISSVQKEAITLMAVRQLSDFWVNNNGNLKTTDFVMTNGSLSLFVRGDIKTSSGKVIAENAIFSPFYYRDTTLSEGNNTVSGPAFIAVWTFNAPPLSGWNYTTNINNATIIDLYTGDSVYAYEIMYDGSFVQSVNLDVNEIDIIDPNKIRHEPLPFPDWKNSSNLPIILIIVGVILFLIGLLLPPARPLVYIGLILIAAGVVLFILDSFSIFDLGGLL